MKTHHDCLAKWVGAGAPEVRKTLLGFELPNTRGEFLMRQREMNTLVAEGYARQTRGIYSVTEQGLRLAKGCCKNSSRESAHVLEQR